MLKNSGALDLGGAQSTDGLAVAISEVVEELVDWEAGDDAAGVEGERSDNSKEPISVEATNTMLPIIEHAVDIVWREPVSLEHADMPRFPTTALPEPLRSFVLALAEALQVPRDMALLVSLGACAGAVAGRIDVRIKRDWTEPLCLFVVCVVDPANRKSAVFAMAMRPLHKIEEELVEAATPRVAEAQLKRRMRMAKLKELEKKGVKATDQDRLAAEEHARILAMEPEIFVPQLLADDTTPESLEKVLASQGGRLILASSEGGTLKSMGGRGSAGGRKLDIYLKGHAGEPIRSDRITRGPTTICRCTITLIFTTQRTLIRNFAVQAHQDGRGLLGRFLFAIPKSNLGHRNTNPKPMDESLEADYEKLIRRLVAVAHHGEEAPRMLDLSTAAAQVFENWQIEVESELADDGRFADMCEWGGKLCGLTARLAGVLHLIATDTPEPWKTPVGVETIESAIALARCAIAHAEVVFRHMSGADPTSDDAVYLREWMAREVLTEFTRRDAQTHGRSRFDNSQRLDNALTRLVKCGWIRQLPREKPCGAGRPSSPRFAVHPKLHVQRTHPAAMG